jgi:hypothetical protein
VTTTDLANITLAKGAHSAGDTECDDPELCFWEWYNRLVRQKHTDAADAAPWRTTYSKTYEAVYPAAKKAVEDKYGPTITEIQDSAIALYDVLITGEWPTAA